IATENNSTTIFPLPIELFRPFLKAVGASQSPETSTPLQPGEPSSPALSAGELSTLLSQLRIGAARGTQQE
ncbi:MAG TPA: hypothetical protein VFT28_10445, partial [Gemmatimonadales bacterium]|nr:hypothetical protein [Gemmatimonadales bacterium]